MNQLVSETREHVALRVIALQIAVAVTGTVLFLAQGVTQAFSAAMGAGVVALGGLSMALSMRFARRSSPHSVLMRLLAGLALKWGVVVGGFYLALVFWKLPILPLFVGFVVALVVFFFVK